jgi:hypothetical protein
MKAKSIKGKSIEDIKSGLANSKADGYKPTLAFVFLSIRHNSNALCTLLDDQGIAVFGATTSAEFTEEGVETEGIAIMLLDINPAYFKIVIKDFGTGTVYASASEIGEVGIQTFPHPAFIMSAANFTIHNDEEVIKGLVDKAGEEVTIVGGMAGEHVNFTGIVFTNDSSSSNGLISLIMDQDKISLKGMAVSGWKSMGTKKIITRCDGSWIHTIDNIPATEVFKKYLGDDIFSSIPSGGVIKTNMNYPLQFDRPGGSPMNMPFLLFNTTEQSVMIPGIAIEGSSFRFSLPPDFDVIDMVIESSRKIKEKELPEADALLVFSCVARLDSLGPMAAMELEGLADTWGKPMVGFFCLGEFGRIADGKSEFHGSTVSWVALKEK